MALKTLRLPLFNDTYYSYSVPLEGNKFTLEFLFLERINSWLISLLDASGNYLVRNQRLTPKALIFADYQLPNLSGGFYFTPIGGDDGVKDIEAPQNTYKLYYIYDDGE